MAPEILYEDKAVLVAVKPRGLLSEGSEKDPDTMPGALFAAYGTVYPVHRLDRGVGGVMVYARTKRAAAELCAAVAAGKLQKNYLAVVSGRPEPECGEWRDYLFKDAALNKSFTVSSLRRGAKEAILSYRVLDSTEREGQVFSKVSVTLQTGRSHQIRVQFASRTHPLVGDGKYGSRVKAPFPALFAQALSFPHPVSGKMLSFCAPAPQEFPFDLFGSAGYEIEHKYLIRYPDPAELTALPGVRIKQMEQTYLLAPRGETLRVRQVECEGEKTFIYTRKVRGNALRALEEEKILDGAEYALLLQQADPARKTIAKTRYCIPWGARRVEVDIYPFWQDRAIAEVEVASEDEVVELPPCIRVIREVSEDVRYKNVNLAAKIPTEPV